jgi:hypothetical protein
LVWRSAMQMYTQLVLAPDSSSTKYWHWRKVEMAIDCGKGTLFLTNVLAILSTYSNRKYGYKSF